MNKIRTSERLSSLLAFALSCLLYIVITALIFVFTENRPVEPQSFNPAPVTLSFSQMELRAVEASPPELEPIPPEEVDVVLEEIVTPPVPEPVKAVSKVTQESAAPVVQPVEPNCLLAWVQEQIENEKYYPPAAQRAGYTGTFQLSVKIGADGTIREAVVLDGRGNLLLRRSLEKILAGLPGRNFGQPLPAPVELPFEFEFKLN